MYNIKYNFSSISNETEAYILGFLYADGYVIGDPSNRLGFQLQEQDLYMVKTIKDYICPDCKIWKEKNNTYKFQICRKEIIENLSNLGIEPNKTAREFGIPLLQESLVRHFIRGYFDGDGSLISDRGYLYAYICSPTERIINSIKDVLISEGIHCSIQRQKRKGNLQTIYGKTTIISYDQFRVNIQSRRGMEKFYEYLYKDSSIKLERKESKFSHWLLNKEVKKRHI